jgi:8-oxo-dGTP diphosphatase
MYTYTLCFITQGSKVLMLNRFFKPNMGRWNGIGGKLEAGETAEQCVLREVWEEAGIKLEKVELTGTVTWTIAEETSGMYVFMAELEADAHYAAPVAVEEGILDWKELVWILNPDNSGIADNIQHFLPMMLAGERCEHSYILNEKEEVTGYSKQPVAVWA